MENEKLNKTTEKIMDFLKPFSNEDKRKIGYRINWQVKKLFQENKNKKPKPKTKKRKK